MMQLSIQNARRIGTVGMVPFASREVDAFHHAQTLLDVVDWDEVEPVSNDAC